jgi:hypothetical protein
LFKSNPLKIVPRQGEAMEADKINDSWMQSSATAIQKMKDHHSYLIS